MKVVVVAEYYPRATDPVFGIWAHRQAQAAAAAGAEVRVVVLHRPVPPKVAVTWPPDTEQLLAPVKQPRSAELDGIQIRYLHYLSPPRWRDYASWGAWAAPLLKRELNRLRRTEFKFDLVHAHYAAPAGDAVRRALPQAPLVISVHGGDVLAVAAESEKGAETVRGALGHARLVLANSAGTERRCTQFGARRTQVVHLGTDVPVIEPTSGSRRPRQPRVATGPELVTVAHLVERKRHADVARAVWLLRDTHPDLRWTVIGDGPQRAALEQLVAELDLGSRVRFTGQLDNDDAKREARKAALFVLPSVHEAFGVAYVEAMAAGVPAIGCRGEDGPEEIAAAGGGIRLVPPGDPEALATELRALLDDPGYRAELGAAARRTVKDAFTWEGCGRATVAAYATALEAA